MDLLEMGTSIIAIDLRRHPSYFTCTDESPPRYRAMLVFYSSTIPIDSELTTASTSHLSSMPSLSSMSRPSSTPPPKHRHVR